MRARLAAAGVRPGGQVDCRLCRGGRGPDGRAVYVAHHRLRRRPVYYSFKIDLGSSFAPNHKGMPVVGEDEKPDFLRRQVLTSRNICGSMLIDLALGGLNYQIEHHLFPSMPRPSLCHAQAPVRAFCAQRGIPYSQTGLLASYTQVLRHLHTTGRTARLEPAAATAAAGPMRPVNQAHAEDSLPPALQAGAYWSQ